MLTNSAKNDFEEGLQLFYDKRFAEASVSFNNVLQMYPEDLASSLYLKRSAQYMVLNRPGFPGDCFM